MNNNRKGVTIVGNRKIMFTMAFVEYVQTEHCLKRKARFKQLRQEEGFLLNNEVLLDEDTVAAIQAITPYLTLGEIIQFKANVVLENLEFISPASGRQILKNHEDQIDGDNNE